MKRTRSNSYDKKKTPARKALKRSKRIPRELSNDRVHYVKRMSGYPPLTISNTINTYAGFQFNLTNMPGYTELTALYDQYKINGIKVHFYPAVTSVNTITTVSTPWAGAKLYTVIDFNDNTAPTSIDQLREYENIKCAPITEQHVRYIPYPKFINSSGQNTNDWVSSSSASTAHYGLKIAADAMNSTSTLSMNYSVEVTYYLAFRNIK